MRPCSITAAPLRRMDHLGRVEAQSPHTRAEQCNAAAGHRTIVAATLGAQPGNGSVEWTEIHPKPYHVIRPLSCIDRMPPALRICPNVDELIEADGLP